MKFFDENSIENCNFLFFLNFWITSTEIWRKMKDHQDLKNAFHWAGKSNKPACKTLRVLTQNKEYFEKFQENFLKFFDQNLYGKLTFFTFLLNISWIFLASLRKYRALEDNTRFLQQFFLFLGGGVPAFPPHNASGRRFPYSSYPDATARTHRHEKAITQKIKLF